MEICIVGGGYVGLTTAVCFAELGHRVNIIDIDVEKVNKINNAVAPIFEQGLQELLEKNSDRITATAQYEINGNVVFICVGTPSRYDGSNDLSFVKDAVGTVGRSISQGVLVVVKSTVFPGTTEQIVTPLLHQYNKEVSVAMNPEFLREGKAIYDFMHPDRVVIGINDKIGEDMLKKLYEPLKAPILTVTPTEAEMIKYASNALLATKISFANELGNLCKRLGVDTYQVMKGVGMDTRIGPHFLQAGIGFGGSCFPKDLRGIYHGAQNRGYEMHLVKAVLDVNDQQPLVMVDLLSKHMDISGKIVAILGLAFKADTDDVRESRSIPLIKELKKRGAIIHAYDPMAMENMKKLLPDIHYNTSVAETLKDADACIIATDWDEFEEIDFSPMKTKVVLEGRRILKHKKNIVYEGICW